LGNFGFQNFGKRLLNPTGTDGIANLLNPFRSTGGGIKLPFVQTAEEKATAEAVKEALMSKKTSDLTVKELLEINKMKSETPGYVKYGIPACNVSNLWRNKKRRTR
jgi:hypothetical protein